MSEKRPPNEVRAWRDSINSRTEHLEDQQEQVRTMRAMNQVLCAHESTETIREQCLGYVEVREVCTDCDAVVACSTE